MTFFPQGDGEIQFAGHVLTSLQGRAFEDLKGALGDPLAQHPLPARQIDDPGISRLGQNCDLDDDLAHDQNHGNDRECHQISFSKGHCGMIQRRRSFLHINLILNLSFHRPDPPSSLLRGTVPVRQLRPSGSSRTFH